MTVPRTRPHRVVHLVSSLGIGGQEVVILNLAKYCDRERFEPHVICIHEEGDLGDRFAKAGISTEVLGTTGRGALAALNRLVRRLRDLQPSVLHTHNPAPNQLGAAARIFTHIPVLVHTKHGRNYHPGEPGPDVGHQIAARLSDVVVAVSADSARMARLVERVPERKLRVIRNGISLEDIGMPVREGRPLRYRGIAVARLNMIKDFPTMLRAVRRIVDAEPRFTLEVVGDGPDRGRIEEVIRELGLGANVDLLGFRHDIGDRLAGADLFLMSSLSEGISLTLLEAMASGLPVVATDVGGNSEVVVNGGTGLLVPSSDPEALAAAALRLLENRQLAGEMGRSGRIRVENEFSADSMVEKYESLYRELLAVRGILFPEMKAPQNGRHVPRPAGPLAMARRVTEGFYRDVLIRGFETGVKRRGVFQYWADLQTSQWYTRDELGDIQNRALSRLIQHAWDTCPYYQETWSALGIGPDALRTPADYARWPIIDRDLIRENLPGMRSHAPGLKLQPKATGGSSGTPLRFFLDDGSYDRRMAAWHRGYGWAGAAPGTKQLYLWGVPLDEQSRWRSWKINLYDRLYRRRVFNSFTLNDASAAEFLARLEADRPDVIVAYANPIYFLARLLQQSGARPFSPRSIVVGAEKLFDFQRELIESVFQAPVFETYGSREFMLIGAECDRHQGLHLTSEHLLIEILTDRGEPAKPGEEGSVVITDLHNFGMPFIRYANGDRAVAGFETCTCGRGLPLLRKVVGRRLDVLTTPDGRKIPGEFFPHLVKDFEAIRRFQVIQDAPDRITLLLIVTSDWRAADEQHLRSAIAAVTGPSVTLDLQRVDDIPLTPAGKLMVVVNRCASS